MALNVGRLCDLMELYAGMAGVSGDKIKPVLLREIINFKLKEFASRTGALATKSTISSVASQMEYELPPDMVHIVDVIYDDYRAEKILHRQVKELAGETS